MLTRNMSARNLLVDCPRALETLVNGGHFGNEILWCRDVRSSIRYTASPHPNAEILALCSGFSPCFHFSIVRSARGET